MVAFSFSSGSGYHEHYGSAGGGESIDPRELEGIGRDDCEFNL
jgi:hypothetical protein